MGCVSSKQVDQAANAAKGQSDVVVKKGQELAPDAVKGQVNKQNVEKGIDAAAGAAKKD
eukprot:CAMPEP_0205827524 /NCGR_PEP_ID=MMETSP0206-20130828/32321_1 /ASSEMBLY_ACC=CAM_ASM_000279 /TAXON_ID=36767 /ORGANISM="Euplotes focardii, Strain TN1" /LENGTH=58 /DNA_ID=CAMNT_0053128519 /DNA_START=22 /DNA_END=198 /DNA_ORIENTATION=+